MVPVTDEPTAPSEQTPDDQPTTERASTERSSTLPPAPWTRYVAIGDSFTEGLWDTSPSDPEQCRGWADRLAETFASRAQAAGAPDVTYANLAVRGKLLRPILVHQLPQALRLKPDLVSMIGGGNDMLRPSADPDEMARNLEDAVIRIRATGADVLLGTGVDAADSPIIKVTRGRVAVYNAHIWSIARRHGAHVVDLWGMQFIRDWRMWAEDRIHLTAEGHRRVAQGALVALGQQPDDVAWETPLEGAPAVARALRARENAQWMREHLYPWAQRRLTGRSSGDLRSAKYPDLTPVEPRDPR